jgi:hypothetical protein
MLDYQRIVDDVRSSLYSHSAEGLDFLRAAAADYSVACEEVNERLRHCGALLRQGLRSEAIQLAEIDPNLLDVVAILDLPERDQWLDLAKRSSIAPPTPLMLDVAAALNEAYAVEQPLAALLQHHRLLALTHAPLPARIQTLRRLAQMDADNPIWQEDLRTFEQERQKQIQAEVEAAVRAGDAAALTTLDAELSSPDWANAPPPALAKLAAEEKTTLAYWAVQSRFEDFVGKLKSAMSAGRLDHGKTLYKRWNEIIADSGLEPYEELTRHAAPALKWVRDNLEREAAVTALAGAVDEEQPVARLKELHRLATVHGELSSSLEEQYRSRVAVADCTARRLWQLKIGVAAAACAAVVVVIGLVVTNERYKQELRTAQAKLAGWIEHRELEEAEAVAAQLSPRHRRDPQLQDLLAAVVRMRKLEPEREANVSKHLKVAREWQGHVEKSLGNDARQSALDGLRGELEQVESRVSQARELERTREERAEIESLNERVKHARDQLQIQLDQAFQKEYEVFDKRLTQMEQDKSSSYGEQENALANLKKDLDRWQAAGAHINPALAPRMGTLNERFFSLQKGIQRRGWEEGDERKITDAVGDIQAYSKALREYVQRNPSADRTPDLKRVADELPCWQAVADWEKLATEWRQAALAGLQPAAANDRLKAASGVLEKFTNCSACESLRTLLPYFQAIAQRDNAGKRIDAPLKKLFNHPLVADVWMLETEDGNKGRQRYYCHERPTSDKDSRFEYVCAFDEKTQTGSLSKTSKVLYRGRAPQTNVAEQIQPVLNTLNDDNWEKSFCRMIAVVQVDRAIDPILKITLLERVLSTGIGGSHYLEKAFARHLEWIKSANIDTFANWLDPTNSDVARVRNEAEIKLRDFPDVVGPSNAVEEDMKTLHRPSDFRWIGWLHRSRDGQYECLSRPELDGDGPLFVACGETAGGKSVLNAIGRRDGKKVTIEPALRSSLAEGRPVYLKVP